MKKWKSIVLFICVVLVAMFSLNAFASSQIEKFNSNTQYKNITIYWKYKAFDHNFLPVFKDKLKSPASNKKTYWQVEYDSHGRITESRRYIRGDNSIYFKYNYENNDLIKKIRYVDNKQVGYTKYEWDGEFVKIEAYCDNDDVESVVYKYTRRNASFFARKYINDIETDETWQWYVSSKNLVNRYIKAVSKNKYYKYVTNQNTGLDISAEGYVNNKYNFTQKFSYDNTGILNNIIAIDSKGNKYSESDYENGLRVREKYNYSNGVKEIYYHSYNSNRIKTKTTCERNGKVIFYVLFEKDSNGNTIKSNIYDTGGDLISTYYDHIYYVKRDGSAKTTAKGKVYKKVKLW